MPLGGSYLELVAVVDQQAAADHSFGRWVASSLPFFIEWGAGIRLPGNTPVVHPTALAAISKLLLEGDPSRLAAWLGNHALPIVVSAGSPAVAAIVLSAATGEIVLGAEQP